ncbi:hypothetical protein PM082_015194 [Marasmius tenuissimus]|nr:hypothetical protein PM082_015194 [Marasmius tenuissimus]
MSGRTSSNPSRPFNASGLLCSQLYAAIFALPVARQLSDPCSVSRTNVMLGYFIIETGGAIKCEHLHSESPHYPPADLDDMEYPLKDVNDAESGRPASTRLTAANSQTSPEFVQSAAGSAPEVWRRNDTSLRHRALERRRKSNELGAGGIAAISVALGGSALCIILGTIARRRHPRGDGSGGGGSGGDGGGGSGDGGGGCGGDGGGGGGDGGC